MKQSAGGPWAGLNKRVSAKMIEQSQSPDSVNTDFKNGQIGKIAGRKGAAKVVDGSFEHNVNSIIPCNFPFGSTNGERVLVGSAAGSIFDIDRADLQSVEGESKFDLVVVNGDGDGEYSYLQSVDINAEVPPGESFDEWVVDDGAPVDIADVNAESTSLTMPANNATVRAKFVSPPIVIAESILQKFECTGGDGGNDHWSSLETVRSCSVDVNGADRADIVIPYFYAGGPYEEQYDTVVVLAGRCEISLVYELEGGGSATVVTCDFLATVVSSYYYPDWSTSGAPEISTYVNGAAVPTGATKLLGIKARALNTPNASRESGYIEYFLEGDMAIIFTKDADTFTFTSPPYITGGG